MGRVDSYCFLAGYALALLSMPSGLIFILRRRSACYSSASGYSRRRMEVGSAAGAARCRHEGGAWTPA